MISVSDKTGVVDLARGLHELGVEVISTGGTAKALGEAGVPVTPISDVTGFPEILDGRVKTLHPKVHGGLLGRRDLEEHRRQMAEHGIAPIDLVAVNLYPFRATVSRPGVTLEEAVENIDIGGPSMVRSAAKNHRDVIVLVNPERYPEVLQALRERGDLAPERRLALAVEAFRHTAFYDAVIAEYLGGVAGRGWRSFPAELTLAFERAYPLRYGENPHQEAAFYRDPLGDGAVLAAAKQLQGKELSYNNLNDAQAAWALVKEFGDPAAVAVKHANPCGVATASSLAEAYRRAYAADPVSIFGGILAFNRTVDGETAMALADVFLEVIIAPGFSAEARDTLERKRNLRLLEVGGAPAGGGAGAAGASPAPPARDFDLRRIEGGLLLQGADAPGAAPHEWKCVTRARPEGRDLEELAFAWKVVKHVKSNAIVVAKGMQTLGVGAGQMNRIDAARIALRHAGERARGAHLASDAFFPFPDVVEEAAAAGIRAIVQPGGSVRDEESIRLADEKGLIMLFTGRRHFRH